MKIIEQSYEILRCPTREEALSHLETCGRTCYKSDCSDAAKFVSAIIKRGHESVLEHCSLTVRFITDRAIMAELTRHRLASFSIESQRYVNYGKEKHGGISFVAQTTWNTTEPKWYSQIRELNLEEAENTYLQAISDGLAPQFARELLPSCTATTIVMTVNFREMRHILSLRTANDAHPQMRALMIPLGKDLAVRMPEIFGRTT